MAPKVLFVLSSYGNSSEARGQPSGFQGWWLPEFAHPFYKLKPYVEIVVASPYGGEAMIDSVGVDMYKDDPISVKFVKEEEAMWKNTKTLETFLGKAGEYAAIFYVGGHGPMFDLVDNTVSQQLIREFYETGKPIASICHGPAAFLKVRLSDGSSLVANQPVTALSNAEEDTMGLSSSIPFRLETELQKISGKFDAAAPHACCVVVSGKDGKMITAQNPASAGAIGEAILGAVLAC
ncbi:putative chaperone protein HSP31 [Amylocarpus encephaloides]|uniref:D-lactate dehydratase n=1 Tax=Amylocarpus encephaloides TaxID=45428 RepID=A0A9P8C1M0_9HELO|nr:putative chaperone protein HSP31 [Amylocarpus encephaloides]